MGVNRYLGGVISADPNTPTVTSASGTWTLEEAYQNIGNWPMAQSQIQNSLRFNSADSAYLSRTPSVAGNRKTWTISVWVKRSTLGGDGWVYDGGSTSNSSGFEFSDDKIRIQSTSSSGAVDDVDLKTTAVYRDPSAWYHVVLAVDTTQTTSTNRVKLYVNGSQVTSFSTTTYPSLNYEFGVNNTNSQKIGKWNISTGRDFNGYLTEFNLIDGLALSADYFGFTDANGIWQPKPYKGAYGTNGFYLPMNEAYQTLTADFLVVAGGGGGSGGRGGGGGAGGYRYKTSQTLLKGSALTVTVGAGGSGTGWQTWGNNGSNSVFDTTSATGGGGGAAQDNNSQVNGRSGGSGGGGGTASGTGSGGSGNAGGYSPVEGYSGGAGWSDFSNFRSGGGGGGSSAAGTAASGNNANAVGGSGTANSITGSSVYYAGGGAGAADSYVAANSLGGGGGSTNKDGTANTGGGGAGQSSTGATGGNGGSGVVIIKIADTNSATFSGGVTYSLSTAVSGYKIYTVTATSTTSETVTFS